MSISRDEFIEILKAEGAWPPIKRDNEPPAFTEYNVSGANVTVDGVKQDVLYVLDGDTVHTVADGERERFRYYSIDTNETRKKDADTEDYADWQANVNNIIIAYALENDLSIDIQKYGKDAHGRFVSDIKVDGTSLSGLFTEAGIVPASGGAESRIVPMGGITKKKLVENSNRAQGNNLGIWAGQNDNKYIVHPNEDKIDQSKKITEMFNDRYHTKRKLGSDITKIGDVYLDIPATHIVVSQLRTSYSVPQIGGESKPISSSSARTIIKMNFVFSGENSINSDLIRIIQQFRYCPINMLYSKDVFEKVVGDNQYLLKGYGSVKDEWFIPVTMDEGNIYTVEGHPDTVGCTLQFSVFNYAAYFNGDQAERVQYYKYDLSQKDLDTREGKATLNRSFNYTLHLEEAVHPYNLYITDHLRSETRRFRGGDSYTEIFKVAGKKELRPSLGYNYEEEDDELFLILNSRVKELTVGTSIYFRNNFAWIPIIGYSQPVAQYIGPGETMVTLSLKTNNNEVISRLMNTFSSESTTDIVDTYYDDRYIVSNSLTRVCGSEICSMKNFTATSVDGHPGYSDINMIFTKSSYAQEVDDINPVAEFDEYWGLQRLISSFGDVVDEAMETELKKIKSSRLSVSRLNLFKELATTYDAANATNLIDPQFASALDKTLAEIKTVNKSFLRRSKDAEDIGIVLSNLPDENVYKKLVVDGASMFERLKIKHMPQLDGNNLVNHEASVLFKEYFNNLSDEVGRVNTKNRLKSFGWSLRDVRSESSYELRKSAIERFGSGHTLITPNGSRDSFDKINEDIRREIEAGGLGVYMSAPDGTNTTSIFDHTYRYTSRIADAIEDTLSSQNMLSTFKQRWNTQSYSEERGKSIILSFEGTPVEARAIYLAFILDNTDSSLRNQRDGARKFYNISAGKIFPNYAVEYSSDDEEFASTEDALRQLDINGNITTWDFHITYVPTNNNQGIKDAPVVTPIDAAELDKAKALREIEKNKSRKIKNIRPFAAHRYFPKCDRLIKHQEVFSTTVGEWFATRYIEEPERMFNQISESVEESISPILDLPAWDNIYFKRSHGQTFIDKIREDSNNPTKILEAINWLSFGRDLSNIKNTANGTSIDSSMSVMSADMSIDENGNLKDQDFPIGTVNEMAICSSGYHDYAKNFGDIVKGFREGQASKSKLSLNSSGRTAINFDLQNRLQGVATGNLLNYVSQVDQASLFGEAGRKVDEPIDFNISSGSYNANTHLVALSKKPTMFMKEVGRLSPSEAYIGPSNGLNKVEAESKSIDRIFSVLQSRNIIGAEYIQTRDELMLEARGHFITLKNNLSPSSYAYYMSRDNIEKYLDEGITADLQNDISQNVYSPNVTTQVDNGTKELVSRNALDSLMPTVGIENAFPTYKMYIIEEDMSDIRYFSLDDYYDLRTLQDLMVVKSKDNPAHTLKARIVVDPRYLTVTSKVRQKIYNKNEIDEFETGIPSMENIDTVNENHFNKGLIPLREGMRICVKLGYHTDPRALDTVFIGTITGLSGNMQNFVYDIEARGDGRELLTPPSQSVRPNVSGENFAEIVSIIMRTSPSITHFGRVYGSFLEKFSRRHFALLALAKSGHLRNALMLGTVGVASGGIYLIARNVVKQAAMGIALASGIGAGLFLLHSYSSETMDLYNKTSLPGSDRNDYEDYAEYSNKIFGVEKGGWAIFSKEFTSARFSQVKKWINGNTFNPEKASHQLAGVMFNTFKQGNNPIDDNVFAVDIWNTLASWRNFDMPINNTRTVWDILCDIKRLYPNFALDVRPYGSRSTLFLGPKGFNMWRTDDPIQALAPQLTSISNTYLFDDSDTYSKQAKKSIQSMVTKNKYGDSKPDENNIAPWKPFQRHHTVASFGDIIMNGIRSTPYRGWNQVVVTYAKSGEDNRENEPIIQSANANLSPNAIRTKYANIDWTDDENIAKQYAIGLLKEGVEKMYGGSLIIKGNSKIEPHDKVFVCDAINKMYGWIEAETVIHKFDMQMGYTTHIVPNMVCAVNNDAYSTYGQVFRRQMIDKWGTLLTSTGAGAIGGFAASAILGPGAWIIGAALAVGATAYSAYSAFKEINKMSKDVVDAAKIEDNVRDQRDFVLNELNTVMITKATKGSYDIGVVCNFVVKLLGKNGLNVKVGMPKTMIANGVNYIVESSVDKYNFAKSYIAQFNNNRVANKAMNTKAVLDNYAKEAGGKKINWAEIEKINDPKKATKKLIKDLWKIVDNAGENLSEEGKATLNKYAKSFTEAETLVNQSRVKTSNIVSVKDAAFESLKKKIPGFKAAAGLGLTLFAIGIEVIPTVYESLLVNAMLNSNTIICHPVYSKYAMLMTGLEGYQRQTSFMHIKGIITQAQEYINTAVNAFGEWDHNIQIGGDISPLRDRTSRVVSSSTGAI